MMKTIKVKDAKIDNHTRVLALSRGGYLGFHEYGEIQTGHYVLVDDIVSALEGHEPRTDADRVAFINQGRYDIEFSRAMGTCSIYDNETRNSFVVEFSTWTEAVDYLMDMKEQS